MIGETPIVLTGPFRAPVQLLAEQTYDGHLSVHDGEAAAQLGLAGAPIEGPTHFTQFEPLLASLWGERWFSHGCISSHFLAMVVEGEEVQATVTSPGPGATTVRIDAAKADGTPVLTGTASVPAAGAADDDHGESELSARLARHNANPPERLVILDQLSVGQQGGETAHVLADFDEHYGDLYPFTLQRKLDSMTETISWQSRDGGTDSPWGAAVVPAEMLSVLTGAHSKGSGFKVRQPSLGLFIDLQVRTLGTPVLVGKTYRVDRDIVGLGESRRTESYWTRSTLVDVATDQACAEVLLHSGVFKDSYPDYPSDESA